MCSGSALPTINDTHWTHQLDVIYRAVSDSDGDALEAEIQWYHGSHTEQALSLYVHLGE